MSHLIIHERGNVTVATINGPEITEEITAQLTARLQQAPADRPPLVVLDMQTVTFLGSIGLGMLMVLLKRVRTAGGQVVLTALADSCRDVIRVCGLDKVFRVEPDVESAARALEA